jgi:hypothetical protein
MPAHQLRQVIQIIGSNQVPAVELQTVKRRPVTYGYNQGIPLLQHPFCPFNHFSFK